MRTERLTDRDMTKVIVTFRSYAKEPKNQSVNAVEVKRRGVYRDPHKTQIHCAGRT
jgi:hypothetical protein